MKNLELRRLVVEYKEIKIKLTKTQNNKLIEQLREIEQRYFHETGRPIEIDIKETT